MPIDLKSSIDLTPIVGLLLTLIVAMLFAAPMSERAAMLDQPPPFFPPGNAPPPPPWHLSMDAAGRLWIAHGEEALRPTPLQEVIAAVPANTRINLSADADVSYGAFAEMVSQLEASGRPVGLVNQDLE
jgi:biopolymer transport protein ExbD